MKLSPVALSVIAEVCQDTPRANLEKACSLLTAQQCHALKLIGNLQGLLSKESFIKLKCVVNASEITSSELALAFSSASAGIAIGQSNPDIHLVWTGPDSPNTSPRDTLPQMLEMIGNAKRSILLVSFAAFKATAIMKSLEAAAAGGVKLLILLESAEDSSGQLSHSAWKAFPKSLSRSGSIWCWPVCKRPKNPKGLPAKLHAKCLIVDELETLVTSANVTDDAMERNIEIGVRCTCSRIAGEIVAKITELVRSGEIVRIQPPPSDEEMI